MEGTYLDTIKSIYEKRTPHIIINVGKPKACPLTSSARQGYPLWPLLFKIVLQVLVRAVRQEKETKTIQTEKEPEFTKDTIICAEILNIQQKQC